MSNEPSYMPLLRRIANAECNAEVYLSAWAKATPRDDVRRVITTVALREGEHAKAFEKRICELGFSVQIEEAPQTQAKAAIGGARDLTDRKKFEKLGLGTPPDTTVADPWAGYFDDLTIDIATGELLGRFISEERDSVRLLAECYGALCAEEDASPSAGRSSDARLDRIETILDKLVAVIDRQSATVSEAEFRAGLRRDGFDHEIRIANYEPSFDGGDLHTHDFSARLLVLDGTFTLRYDSGQQTLSAGQCCEVPSGTRHAECAGERGARVLAGLKHH